MFSILVILSLLIVLSFIIITAINAVFGPFLSESNDPVSEPKASILVPARNEEKNIAVCLDHLLMQDYPDFEIIVLDDQSDDRTSEFVMRYTKHDHRVRYISGSDLPQGWNGKNWACHQLSQHATGNILIFTDADTMHGKLAVKKTIGRMQFHNLGILSSFPQQITVTFSEKLIVPVIELFVYGMLPLWLTFFSKRSSFSAANGQWIAFTKDAYFNSGGHEAVKTKIVEDVELMRLAKNQNIRAMTLAGTDLLYCRMYHSPAEVWRGFSKNFYGLTGNNPVLFFILLSVFAVGFLFPFGSLFLNLFSWPILVLVGLNLTFRFLLSLRFRHPILISLFLHPVSILYAIIIGINSFYLTHFGMFKWKERNIRINQA